MKHALFITTVFTLSSFQSVQGGQSLLNVTEPSGCVCPQISIETAQKIINEGNLPGYTVFVRPIHKTAEATQIITIKELPSYRDPDDNCICEYQALDNAGKEIYNIAIEAHEGINKEPSER